MTIKDRINTLVNLFAVSMNGEVDSKAVSKALDSIEENHVDSSEMSAWTKRREMIETLSMTKLKVLYAYCAANKDNPISMSYFASASFSLLKNGLWADIMEVIHVATGHELRYSPSFFYSERTDFVNEEDLVFEFKTEKKCREAYPDHSSTPHLKGMEGYHLVN